MGRNRDLPAGEIGFCAITGKEHQHAAQHGVRPRHQSYECGGCGKPIQGRVVCEMQRPDDGHEVLWCLCSCEKLEPSVLRMNGATVVGQSPIAKEFHPNPKWPPDLAALYEEAAKSYAAGAHTACAMVCRKVLMATACAEGDQDGKSFAQYVDYITTSVLSFPRAKASIDSIRNIGNDANHKIVMVAPDDSKRAMLIVTYMLDTIYSLPAA